MLAEVYAACLPGFQDNVWMSHEFKIVFYESPSVAVGVVVMVRRSCVAAYASLPPVGHSVTVGVIIIGTRFLGIVLPSFSCSVLCDVLLCVYLSLNA